MALDTYANLIVSIRNWLLRPGDTTFLPDSAVADLITLFEAEARDRLRTRFEETSTNLTTVASTATLALPTDYWEARSVKLSSTNPVATLVYMAPEQLNEFYDGVTTGQPVNYTIEGLNLRFGPIPGAAYTVALGYMQGITALSDSAPTNWLLTRYPDLYLTGSLLWAEAFIADDERVSGWAAAKEAAFNRIAQSDIKARWSGSTLQIKTDTGNP